MTAIATTIAKLDSCPDVIIQNTTSFPSNSTHSKSNFTQYVKLSISQPNDITVVFSSAYPNQVLPPASNLYATLVTCLVGRFVANYSALPTPPESPVVGQNNEYNPDDNFYYDGVIYNVKTPSFVFIPAVGFTNEELIEAYLTVDAIEVIDEADINSKYKAEISFTSWCTLDTCLLDKLEKINCLIVQEPTRNDLCEKELYEQIIQLNYAKYAKDEISQINTAENIYKLKSISNYVNSICCCSKCKNNC